MSSLTRAYMGLLMKMATTGGDAAPERIVDAMSVIPEEAITQDIAGVWSTIRATAEQGGKPTLLLMRKANPGYDDAYWKSFSTSHPDITSLQSEIIRDAMKVRLREILAAAESLIDANDPQTVHSFLSGELERPMAGAIQAVHASEIDFVQRIKAIKAGTVPVIRTPWPDINDKLGGGFFVGGEDAMSALLGYTGTGKTVFATQIGVRALMDGHHVLYLAGESSRGVVKGNFARLWATVPKVDMRVMSRATEAALMQADAWLKTTHLYIYDKQFNVDVLRSMMAQRAAELKRMIAEGLAGPETCLLVIVDNLDHVIESNQNDEWKVLESAAKSIYNTSRRLECVHTLVLAQATDYAFLRGDPAGLNGFARSKLIASHCSNVISLYRPTTAAMQDDDKTSQPKIGVPKTRSGDSGERLAFCDPEMGVWM